MPVRLRYREVMHGSWFVGAHRWGVVLASGLLTLTGCGIASPADSAPPLAPPPPPPPGRPFELPLQTASSCQVLSGAQRARLGFDKDPLPASPDVTGGDRSCSYRDSRTKSSARIGLVTSRGPRTDEDMPALQVAAIGVGGFPAMEAKQPGLNRACSVQVDVARGQHLDVLFTQYGRSDPPPQRELCRRGEQVAADAVSTLAHPDSAADAPPDPEQDASGTEHLKSEAVSPRLPGNHGR